MDDNGNKGNDSKVNADSILIKRTLTEKEVSRLTGRARSTLQKDRFYRRGIPFIKRGRQVLYYPEDVREYMKGTRVEVQ
jgi:hypothetical protein